MDPGASTSGLSSTSFAQEAVEKGDKLIPGQHSQASPCHSQQVPPTSQPTGSNPVEPAVGQNTGQASGCEAPVVKPHARKPMPELRHIFPPPEDDKT